MTVWVCFVRMFESVQWLASVCVRFYTRGNISNTNEQLDRVWRHSLFQKSGPRA